MFGGQTGGPGSLKVGVRIDGLRDGHSRIVPTILGPPCARISVGSMSPTPPRRLKSARHHWWPRRVSKHWAGRDGLVGRLTPDGSVRSTRALARRASPLFPGSERRRRHRGAGREDMKRDAFDRGYRQGTRGAAMAEARNGMVAVAASRRLIASPELVAETRSLDGGPRSRENGGSGHAGRVDAAPGARVLRALQPGRRWWGQRLTGREVKRMLAAWRLWRHRRRIRIGCCVTVWKGGDVWPWRGF